MARAHAAPDRWPVVAQPVHPVALGAPGSGRALAPTAGKAGITGKAGMIRGGPQGGEAPGEIKAYSASVTSRSVTTHSEGGWQEGPQ